MIIEDLCIQFLQIMSHFENFSVYIKKSGVSTRF